VDCCAYHAQPIDLRDVDLRMAMNGYLNLYNFFVYNNVFQVLEGRP